MQPSDIKGKVDFGIITIREDEFEAVLARFPAAGRVTGRRHYNIRQAPLPGGGFYLIAVLRCIEQGNGEAQSAAHDLLEDLAPQWLLVVGIAGGVPSEEFSLGDVIVSTHIHDFSVEAVLQGSQPEYALTSRPVDRDAAVLVANIPALKAELEEWNSPRSIGIPRPEINVSDAALYGSSNWSDQVRKSLLRHAGWAEPKAVAGAIASSDRLIKDTEILTVWTKMVRQVLALEMESAGVYRATYGRRVPTLSIRGISDIVGFKRNPSWTQYACHTAAAFTLALVKTRPFPTRNPSAEEKRPLKNAPSRLTSPASAANRPRVFIGSSRQGLETAEYIQLGLDQYAECTIWSQGVFGQSEGSLETLCQSASQFDFAILVLTPGDLAHEHTGSRNSPRDNVLFEIGFFAGALGRERVYAVYCRDEFAHLPIELAGVPTATYGRRFDGNVRSAVGPVCTQIKSALQTLSAGQGPSPMRPGSEAIDRVSSELKSLRVDFALQTEHVRRLMEMLTSGRAPNARQADSAFLRMLEGTWKNPFLGSMAYARLIRGELRFIYCYSGNDHLTGEYYHWQPFNDALLARFRWFGSQIKGVLYFEKVSANRLRGGWWYASDVPEHLLPQLPRVEGMNLLEWVRQDDASAIPPWAQLFFKNLESAP